jgi:hypothetical protein
MRGVQLSHTVEAGLLAGAGVAAIPDVRIDLDVAVPSNVGTRNIAVGAIRSIIRTRRSIIIRARGVAVAASDYVRPGALGFLASAAAAFGKCHADRTDAEHRRKERRN